MQQKAIRFWSEGDECAGMFYLPDKLSASQPAPALVLGHGTASVKEMHLPSFARHFIEAGLVVLTIDYRFLGESGGQPRQTVNPRTQVEDYRNAISWLERQPEVDPRRIGIWGTSGSGGVVLQVAAFDRRVKAVVSQIPAIALWRYLPSSSEVAAMYQELVQEERQRLSRGEEPGLIQLAAPQGERSVFGSSGFEWHVRVEQEIANFHNEITVLSLDYMTSFDAGAFIDLIAPTPLLMILADEDELIPTPINLRYFERAKEPKHLLTYHGGHYSAYDDPETHLAVAQAARDWFLNHLV